MKVVILMCVFATSVARFVTYDEVEHLFEKFAHNRRLSKYEKRTLGDVFEILRMDQYWHSVSLHTTSKPRMTLYCLACRVVADILFKAVNSGLSDEELSWVLTKLCTALHIENHKVCKGAVVLNVPILRFIITNTPEAAPRTFCGLILQTDNDPYACVYDDPRFEWQVDLPDSTAQKRIVSKSARPLKVALITDVHIDPLYDPHGEADSREPVGCRRGRRDQTVSRAFQNRNINESIYEHSFFIKKGDIVLDLSIVSKIRKIRNDQSAPTGYWGDYRNCDTPLWTYNDVIDRITTAHKSVDVVYYIGDTIGHRLWESTYAWNKRMNHYVIEKLRRSFGDEVLVVPVIGNHESQPINEFAPSSVKGNNLNTTWLYKSLAKMWGYYMPNGARATFLKYGAYSVRVRPGLKAIIMNSNVAYKYNWWLVYDPLDAKRHLEWLVEELHKSELNGEKVHILSHIPPGEAALTYTWTREYRRIVNRFASTIAAEFNGHMHWDEFKIFYNSEGEASRVAWNGGGVTTFANFNPNYKIVTFHPHTHEPKDIENYIFNLTEANLHPKRKPHWFRLYDFKRKFGLPDLSPASMDALVKRMASDGNDLLDLYLDYSYKMSDARPWCDTDCQLDYLCRTVVTVLWDRQKCDELGLLRSKP